MAVALQHGAGDLLAHLVAIGRGIGGEEALVAREAADHRRFLAAQRQLVGGIGNLKSGKVADVLAQCAEPVHAGITEGAITVVLAHQPVRLGDEEFVGFIGPPVEGSARGIELTALVVEAMAHLVADHGADAAIVDGRVRARIEEGRLQDAGGQHERVAERIVEGVHDVRVRRPARAVHRLAEISLLLIPLELVGGVDALDQLAGFNRILAEVAPSIRIADHALQGEKLFQRRATCLVVHPFQRPHPCFERRADIADDGFHLSLVGFGEVTLHVELGHCIAKVRVHDTDGELPAFRLFGDARELTRIVVEGCVREGFRQVGRKLVRDVELHPEFPVLNRKIVDESTKVGHRGLVHHDIEVAAGKSGCSKEPVPVESRRVCLELGVGHGAHRLVRA